MIMDFRFGYWIKRSDRNKICYVVIGALLFALPLAVQAQQTQKAPRIGFLAVVPFSNLTERTEAFRRGLRELGYVEGKNILVEWRSADGKADRLPVG